MRIKQLWYWVMLAGMIPGLVSAAESPRVALVIGNGNYSIGRLKNPVNDANLMAATLEQLGFSVTKLLDGTLEQMKQAVLTFSHRLAPEGQGQVALVYYAGHGVQRQGRNYLIPVDAEIGRSKDLDLAALDASTILRTLDTTGNYLNFLILDACRNDPFPRDDRSGRQGLARIDADSGTLIAYSTAPDSVAEDGDGANSRYTLALAGTMSRPKLAVERMFRYVRNQVMQATGGHQVPWESSSLTGEDYFFNPGPVPIEASAVTATPPLPPPAAQSQERTPGALSFDLNFLTRAAAGGEFRHFNDGDTLASGDLYKIVIRPQADSYLYIFQVGSTGAIDRLFPMATYAGRRLNNVNPMQRGKTYFLPAPDKAFYLDHQRGKETIYVFASPTPRPDLENLSTALASAPLALDPAAVTTAPAQLLGLFKSRDLPLTPVAAQPTAPRFAFSQDGRGFEAVASSFTSTCADCVHVLEFTHQ